MPETMPQSLTVASPSPAVLLSMFDDARKRTDHSPAEGGRLACKGITHPLHQVYYPTFRPRYDSTHRKKDRTTNFGLKGRAGCKTNGSRQAKGLMRGTVVDTQIRDLVRGVPVPKPHPFTRAVGDFMRAQGWRGLDVQTPVWCPTARLRTEIDLVCLDSNDNIVLVELKCGFVGYYTSSSECMLHELSSYGASPMCQHQAQLGVTRELFIRTFKTKPHAAYVLLINEHTQKAYSLRNEMMAHVPKVVDRLTRYVQSMEVGDQQQYKYPKAVNTNFKRKRKLK